MKVTVFTNPACPHCATFMENYDSKLLPAIERGQLELILKPFDKPKSSLLKGNLVHLFLDYSDREKMNPVILQLFQHQQEWCGLSDDALRKYLTEQYGLSVQPENTDYSLTITQEAIRFDAISVPTVMISRDGEAPRRVDREELFAELEAAFAN